MWPRGQLFRSAHRKNGGCNNRRQLWASGPEIFKVCDMGSILKGKERRYAAFTPLHMASTLLTESNLPSLSFCSCCLVLETVCSPELPLPQKVPKRLLGRNWGRALVPPPVADSSPLPGPAGGLRYSWLE